MDAHTIAIENILTPDALHFFEPTDDASVFLYEEADGVYRITLWSDESLSVHNGLNEKSYANVLDWLRSGWEWTPGVNEHTARYLEACAELMRIQMRLFPDLIDTVGI